MREALKLFILFIPLIAFIFYSSRLKKSYFSILVSLYLISLIAISFFDVAKNISDNYSHPPEGDFLAFWMNGRAALSGENFYNAKTFQEIELPYNPSDGFREEIIDVGFWYPPFAMFLFLPLGLANFSNAFLIWQIVNVVFCFVCIYEIWKLSLREYGILSLFLIAALFLMLTPTRNTFHFAQTNFIALLFFLNFWKNRSNGKGGIWLALVVVVKPYGALLYLYPLLKRNWRVLVIAIASLLLLTVLSGLVFGSDVLMSFLKNPTPDVPGFLYYEDVNQSLLAAILRSSNNQITNGSPVFNPIYLGISIVLSLTTVIVTAANKHDSDDWMLLSILFLALIIYPAALEHYSVFLILPIVLLLQPSDLDIRGRLGILIVIFITYFLSTKSIFWADIFIWIVCIGLVANPRIQERINSRSKLESA